MNVRAPHPFGGAASPATDLPGARFVEDAEAVERGMVGASGGGRPGLPDRTWALLTWSIHPP